MGRLHARCENRCEQLCKRLILYPVHVQGKEEIILQHDKISGRVIMNINQVSKPNVAHKPAGMLKVSDEPTQQ